MADGGFSQSAHAHAHLGGSFMAFVRSIGRWSLTALVNNAIVGASISGCSEPIRLVGRAGPLVVLLAA
jgi:hypothetical protein